MLDLSIIIVNHNGERFIEDCLNSIYEKTHKISFEIIFVDNGSSDLSVAVIKSKFPRVKILQNSKNLGFCQANTQGLSIYQGRYALLLNVDTIAENNAFDRMVEWMNFHPKVGACGPKLLNLDGTIQHQGGLLNKRFWLSSSPLKADYIIGACLMVRREVIDQVGVLDENFFFSNDDLDWCRRIRKAGWEVYFIPQAEIMHYGGFTTKLFSQNSFVEGFRGGLYFCKKHYGNFIYQVYRFLLILFMLKLIAVAALLRHKKLGAFFQILMLSIKGEITAKYKPAKRILLVSNGHAEDLTAAAIGAGLMQKDPNIKVAGFPLVGFGKAYVKQGIENLGLHKALPSGGFAKEGFRYLLKDIFAGWFTLFFKQIGLLRKEGKRADLIVAVGDAYVVALCGLFGKKPLVFIDGPKSVKIEGYYPLEKWLLRKYCRKVIVQDQETADYLKKEGIPASFLGSWVMDYVAITGEDFGIEKDRTVIGILPGTREEAYDNLGLILEVLENMYKNDNKIIGLVASTLDRKKIKVKGWEFSDGKLVSKSGATALVTEEKFGDVCVRSKLIIGLAGIANEQAVALGKPVVCFQGSGAQTTLRRWKEIQKITGPSMEILYGNASQKAQRIFEIMQNQKLMDEMSRIGRESKPQWGGIERIAHLVADPAI